MSDTQWTPVWDQVDNGPEQNTEYGAFGGKLSQANLAETSGWGNTAATSDELAH
mgnify:CR=1 FL=1